MKFKYKNEVESLSGATTPEELFEFMKENISYSKFTNLKSPEEVFESRTGSCHDYVMFQLHELGAMNKNPEAIFVMEINPETKHIGETHSFVTLKENGKILWLENAWENNKGIHVFNSIEEIKQFITEEWHKSKFGNSSRYTEIYFEDFGEHVSGESLQTFVNKNLDIKR